MNKDYAIARVRLGLDDACSLCKWRRPKDVARTFDFCIHPTSSYPTHHSGMVGVPYPHHHYWCVTVRRDTFIHSSGEACGPEAIHFEPKED